MGTLQSAESLMLGMYPPDGSYTEVVDLHTMDSTFDDITANPTYVHWQFKHFVIHSLNIILCTVCAPSLQSTSRSSKTALCGTTTRT